MKNLAYLTGKNVFNSRGVFLGWDVSGSRKMAEAITNVSFSRLLQTFQIERSDKIAEMYNGLYCQTLYDAVIYFFPEVPIIPEFSDNARKRAIKAGFELLNQLSVFNSIDNESGYRLNLYMIAYSQDESHLILPHNMTKDHYNNGEIRSKYYTDFHVLLSKKEPNPPKNSLFADELTAKSDRAIFALMKEATGSEFPRAPKGEKMYYLPLFPENSTSQSIEGIHQKKQAVIPTKQQVHKSARDIAVPVIKNPSNKAGSTKKKVGKKEIAKKAITQDGKTVFVVHGRNLEMRDSMFNFLRTIGLKPLEWTKAIETTGKPSPFIGEILDMAFNKAQAVVILMTPDDEARLKVQYRGAKEPSYEVKLTHQSRQNVLFEAGMSMGRCPERTVLVEIGTLRPYSDIAGRHVVRLNNSSQKRQDLASRLKNAGCRVDMSGTDWHSIGDFEKI
jgi:predicted nucleotide-binding protein